jgi:alkylhydroperoxidase family enzyme
VAWIRTVRDEEARGHLAELFAAAIRRAGKVFGIVRAMSLAPRTLEVSLDFYRAILFGESPLTRRQREMLAVVTSWHNHCHY